MLAAYGVDVLSPATSCRRVHVLLQRLPPHFRRGGEAWSTEAELLAGVADRVAELTWVMLRVNGTKAARPKPIPRPQRPRPAAVTRVPQEPPQAARSGLRAGQKASSWTQAMTALAGMPGVKVSGG